MKLIVYPKGSESVEFDINRIISTNYLISFTLMDNTQKQILLEQLNAFKVLEEGDKNR